MSYYIGLDLGTSGVKGVVFDSLGNVVDSYLEEYDIISPKNGYAEEDPNIWFEKTLKVLKSIGVNEYCNRIKGIGLSGQMHGLVILDKNDNVLRNSIIWCDNRTDKEAKDITNIIGKDDLLKITGNIAMPAFTLAKLLWVKRNEPIIFNKIAKVMLPKDYIRYMLTKSFSTDYSDISGSQMMDINKLDYSKELLNKLDIPLDILPPIKRSDEITGYLTKDIEAITNLNNVFICGGAGDQAAGAIGNGIINSSDASIVLGSSGVVYTPTNKLEILPNGEFQSFVTSIYGKYHVMGVTNGCGTSLKWLRDNMFNLSYNEMTFLANDIPCGSNNLYYLPYLMGERTPILDNNAKGLFIGIKNTTSKAEMIRAVMEGVGYSIKDCFNLITDKKDKVLISGGGAKSNLYCKIIASMIKCPVVKIKQAEGPSLGAAILAMVAGKEYRNIEDACNNIIKVDSIVYPVSSWSSIYDKGYKIYKKLYENNKEIYKIMKENE